VISRLLHLAIIAAAACCATPAIAQWQHDEIVIRIRYPSLLICRGVCPSFETQVTKEGHVRTRDLRTNEVYEFEATPEDLSRFVFLIGGLRSSIEDRKIDEVCTYQDGSPDTSSGARPDDLEVRWSRSTQSTRLTACASNRELRVALEGALLALGASPYSGQQLKTAS
jgi:hypothetical protein